MESELAHRETLARGARAHAREFLRAVKCARAGLLLPAAYSFTIAPRRRRAVVP